MKTKCNTTSIEWRTSEANRTQRVQWMQRVMMVLMMGPSSLSSTDRLNCNSNYNEWLQHEAVNAPAESYE